MKIKDLKPSILEMSYSSALDLITEIRRDRKVFKQKRKKTKSIVNIELDPSTLSPEMARKLLEALGVEIE